MKEYNDITLLKKTNKAAMEYLNFTNNNNELEESIPGYSIYVNLGMNNDTNHLSPLALPILVLDNLGNRKVFLDLRPYKKNRPTGTTIEDNTIKSTDKDTLILLSKTILTFDSTAKIVNIKLSYVKSLTFFLYAQLERAFLLNNIDKSYIMPAIASFVINILDSQINTESVHYILKKQKLLLEDNEDTMAIIDGRYKHASDVDGFVEYMKKSDVTGKFTKLNSDVLMTLLMASTMGQVNKRLATMVLEHPVPWLTLVNTSTGNTLLKKTSLATNLSHYKRVTEYNKINELMDRVL